MQDPNESFLKVCKSGDSFQDISPEPEPEEVEEDFNLEIARGED